MGRATLQLVEMFSNITTACPQCGRQHVTVFKLRHITDSVFRRLGELYQYAEHEDAAGSDKCPNSGKNPNWGGPAKPRD